MSKHLQFCLWSIKDDFLLHARDSLAKQFICPLGSQAQAMFNQPCSHALAQNIHYCFLRWGLKEMQPLEIIAESQWPLEELGRRQHK